MKWGASSPIQLLDSRHRAKSCPSDSHSRTTSLSNLQRAWNCKHLLATRLYKVVKFELRHVQAPPPYRTNCRTGVGGPKQRAKASARIARRAYLAARNSSQSIIRLSTSSHTTAACKRRGCLALSDQWRSPTGARSDDYVALFEVRQRGPRQRPCAPIRRPADDSNDHHAGVGVFLGVRS